MSSLGCEASREHEGHAFLHVEVMWREYSSSGLSRNSAGHLVESLGSLVLSALDRMSLPNPTVLVN